jgi:hypothetical protein
MTEQAKHTAGRWGVEDPMDHCLTVVANPEAPVHQWVWVATCDWPDEDDHAITAAEVKANAYLIASAPDLLAVLRAEEAFLVAEVCAIKATLRGKILRYEQRLAEVRAAIAKAEGR